MFLTIQIYVVRRFWPEKDGLNVGTQNKENEGSVTNLLNEMLEENSVTNLLNDLDVDNFQSQTIQDYLEHVEEPFVQEYVNNSIGIDTRIDVPHFSELKVEDVFEINRPDDEIEFRRDLHNRRFLWHGTRKANIHSILRDGFDLKYAKETGMFGKGIYFSDCCTKSLYFCNFSEPNLEGNRYTYLFLCEVALGDVKEHSGPVNNAENKLNGKNSVLGKGAWAPPSQISNPDGISYCSEPLELTRLFTHLTFNEYIVYDTNQIRLRYLVKISNVFPSFFQYFIKGSPYRTINNLERNGTVYYFFGYMFRFYVLPKILRKIKKSSLFNCFLSICPNFWNYNFYHLLNQMIGKIGGVVNGIWKNIDIK